MTWMDSVGFKILEDFKYIPPGPIALSKMHNYSGRQFAMDNLSKTEDSKSAWCNVVQVFDKRRKYCTNLCQDAAYNYCYPQMPGPKAARIILLQDSSCTLCGLDHSEMFYEKAMIHFKSNLRGMNSSWWSGRKDPTVYFSQLGQNTGDVLHVDHIIPLFKGGRGIGFDNVQVVCKSCHILKTIRERK